MSSVTYNIPVRLVSEYAGRSIIVRSADPSEIVRHLAGRDIDNVFYAQLLSADVTPDAISELANCDQHFAIDIVLNDPAAEFPLLYNFSKLLDRHPIRVSIPVRTGFVKAVKLALALELAVKINVGQPNPALIEEMSEVLDLYLHRANVSQPVEFFHSLFLAAYNEQPANIWMIQEEDPEHFVFVGDNGVETVSPRFGDSLPYATGDVEIECDTCKFLPICGGYFKWPDRKYSCEGVKTIFASIDTASSELRENIASYNSMQEGAQ